VSALAEHRALATLAPLAEATATVTARAGAPPANGATLGTVLGLLDAHRAMELARAMQPGRPRTETDDRQARQDLIAAIGTLIGYGIAATGRGQWVMSWAGPSRLVAADASFEQMTDWIGTAVDDPDQVSWLRTQLAGLGVDPAAVPIPGRSATGPDPRSATRLSGGPTPRAGAQPRRGSRPRASLEEGEANLRARMGAGRRAAGVAPALGIVAGLVAIGLIVWASRSPAPDPVHDGYPYSPGRPPTPVLFPTAVLPPYLPATTLPPIYLPTHDFPLFPATTR
jgi:hypothetical protein